MTKLIVALDVPNYEDAMDFVESLDDAVDWYKVGLELFISDGAVIMQTLKRMKKQVMLDLKLHDIPETVARATKVAVDLGADMLTLHTLGGRKMMEGAVKAAEDRVKLLGVTVLTSHAVSDLREVGVYCQAPEIPAGIESTPTIAWQVHQLAELAGQCGVHGLVCSALEAGGLHQMHPGFTLVTPGIRPAGGDAGDQKRVATPAMAREAGASFIVVGRPIRDVSPKVRQDVVKSIQAELGNA
jgi:orotidine-5'-phosphate decarboxylase